MECPSISVELVERYPALLSTLMNRPEELASNEGIGVGDVPRYSTGAVESIHLQIQKEGHNHDPLSNTVHVRHSAL